MNKLDNMLYYISENNDFYKRRIKEYCIKNPLDITQWPILTRQELQENRYNMFSNGYQLKYYNQQLRRQSSSGSSGTPVNVYWDNQQWIASNLSLWRKRLQWYGIHPNDKYVVFTLNALNLVTDGTTVLSKQESPNVLAINASLIQNERQYQKLVDIINSFNPDWLYVQPFFLNKIAQIFEKYGTEKLTALRYIESIGELLPLDLRRRVAKVFKVPLANMYGSEEMNCIALESPAQHMMVLEDNVFVEVMSNNIILPHGEGESIITNLHNKAMPLIRYNQGDLINLEIEHNNKRIRMISGRKIQEIQIGNRLINAFAFSEIITSINNQLDDIIYNYQFVYSKSAKRLLCKIIIDNSRNEWFLKTKEILLDLLMSKINISINDIDVVQIENIQFVGQKQTALIVED